MIKSELATVRRLSNGLTVVCQENHLSHVVALQIWFGVGSADEDPALGEVGLAHLNEHMLFKGTARRGVGEIARAVESAGGEINAWTSFDNTVYYVAMASRYFTTGLDVLADAVQHSAFDAVELDREREVVLEEIKRSQDIPARIISKLVFAASYKLHPYRRPVIGTEQSVKALTREQLLAFYQRHYRPERAVLAVAGDFDTDTAMQQIEEAFAGFASGGKPLPQRAQEPEQSEARVQLAFGDTQETHLSCAWRIPPVDHDDVPAIDVLSVVLGHGDSSQLSRALRFKQRLVTEAYAYAYTPRDSGLLIVGAALHHDSLFAATSAALDEVAQMRDGVVAPRELDKAKIIIESEAVYQRETAQGVARKLGFFQSVLGDLAEEDKYYQAVREVTPQDVQRVAQKYLTPKRLSCVALAPKELESNLSEQRLVEAASKKPPRRRQNKTKAGPSGAVRVTLDSGARVLVLPDHSIPIISYRAVWLAGQRVETQQIAGCGNLAARLLTKGTASRSALEIAHAVDAMAATLDGFSGRNTMGLYGDFLGRFADQGFELFCDCAQRPAFREEDLDRERHSILEMIRAREDDLPGLTFRLFSYGLYPTHPYRLDPLGTRATVEASGPDLLSQFHASHCGVDRAVLVIAGDIEVDRALTMAEMAFGSKPETATAAIAAPTVDTLPSSPRVLRLQRDRAQAHIVVGFTGSTFGNDDRFALEVLSSTLSGQSGRLFVELRDRRSLAYAVSALSVEGIEPGYFAVYIGTSPEKVDEAVSGVQEQLAALQHQPPTAEEVERTKRYLIGAHEIGLQRVGSRASIMAFNEVYDIGYEAHLDYAKRIEAVTQEDLQRVAREILLPERAVIAIVGPEGCGGPEATLEVDLETGQKLEG